ncbi:MULTISPECIES: AMP-binding protein [unclassified Corynebacterium]|uniref:AMP-binding protein n=1 Tax=unclassified Corynebacterium TaxID=2624378 RepID=UPI003F8F67E7
MKLEALPVALNTASVAAALPVLQDVLAGRRAVLPVPPDARAATDLQDAMRVTDVTLDEAPGTLIACTSGSTGLPKGARLRAANLLASADATASYLRARFGTAPGPWLLALPPHHIAGLQVILRSQHAGHSPTVMDDDGRFTAAGFVRATADLRDRHPGENLHTSLVPTQLHRLLDGTDDTDGTDTSRALAALREYAAILVGGAATSPELVARCRQEGVPIVLTYGSSETAGGVVYDGEPIPGTVATIEEASGRILLSGPTVADGYRNVDGAAEQDAFPATGTFRTSDLGAVEDGVLTVRGRADGALNSGGLKILPEEVEAVLSAIGYRSCVVGLADDDLGEAVVALVESEATAAELTDEVRAALKASGTAGHLIPRRVLTTSALPATGPGKVDRRAVHAQMRTRLRS